MLLTREQAGLLMSLRTVIEVEWKLNIGYSCPMGSFTDGSEDFILWEELMNPELSPEEQQDENNWQPYLLHAQDMEKESHGIVCREHPKAFSQHDDDAEKFWQRVEKALNSGEIYCEPGITRFYDYKGEKIQVDVVHHADGTFGIDVYSKFQDTVRRSGKRRTLQQLQEEVEKNEKNRLDPVIQSRLAELEPMYQEYIVKEDFIDGLCLKAVEEILALKVKAKK